MRQLLKNPHFSAPVALFFLIGAFGLYHFPYGDEILFLNTYRTPFWNPIFKTITLLGEWYFWVATLFFLAVAKWKAEALAFLAVGILLIPVNYVLKDQIGIDRPITFFEKKGMRDAVITVPDLYLNSGKTSFPSGHTASAFALYTLLAAFFIQKKKNTGFWSLLFATTATLVGFSRVFLAQHFIIDILAGACLGFFLASVGFWLRTYLSKRFFKEHIPLA